MRYELFYDTLFISIVVCKGISKLLKIFFTDSTLRFLSDNFQKIMDQFCFLLFITSSSFQIQVGFLFVIISPLVVFQNFLDLHINAKSSFNWKANSYIFSKLIKMICFFCCRSTIYCPIFKKMPQANTEVLYSIIFKYSWIETSKYFQNPYPIVVLHIPL